MHVSTRDMRQGYKKVVKLFFFHTIHYTVCSNRNVKCFQYKAVTQFDLPVQKLQTGYSPSNNMQLAIVFSYRKNLRLIFFKVKFLFIAISGISLGIF